MAFHRLSASNTAKATNALIATITHGAEAARTGRLGSRMAACVMAGGRIVIIGRLRDSVGLGGLSLPAVQEGVGLVVFYYSTPPKTPFSISLKAPKYGLVGSKLDSVFTLGGSVTKLIYFGYQYYVWAAVLGRGFIPKPLSANLGVSPSI